MTWIRVDTALPRHPKVSRFAKAMGMSRHEAIGLLVDLWAWSVDYAEDGDITRYSGEELMTSLGAMPTAALVEIDLLQALEDSGLADRVRDKLVLHDWDAHQGQLIAQREKNRERQRKYAERRKAEKPLANALANTATNEHNEQNIQSERTKRPADRHDEYVVLEHEGLKPITEADCKRWRELFPDIDLDIELEKIYQYLESAPKSKKPKASLPRFAMNWLQRTQKEVDKEQHISKREQRKRAARQAELDEQMKELLTKREVSKEGIQQAKHELAKVFRPRDRDYDDWRKQLKGKREGNVV